MQWTFMQWTLMVSYTLYIVGVINLVEIRVGVTFHLCLFKASIKKEGGPKIGKTYFDTGEVYKSYDWMSYFTECHSEHYPCTWAIQDNSHPTVSPWSDPSHSGGGHRQVKYTEHRQVEY